MEDPRYWSNGLVDRQGIRVGMPDKHHNRRLLETLRMRNPQRPNLPQRYTKMVKEEKTNHPPTTSAAYYQVTKMNNTNPKTVKQGALASLTAGGLVSSTKVTRRPLNTCKSKVRARNSLKKLGVHGPSNNSNNNSGSSEEEEEMSSEADRDEEEEQVLEEVDFQSQGEEQWIMPSNGTNKVGPRRTKAQLKHLGMYQICIWSSKNVSVKNWWREVTHIMGELHQNQMGWVHKIIRVRQKVDNVYRYDLFTTPSRGDEFLSLLLQQAAEKGVDWKIRKHISWRKRHVQRNTQGRRKRQHQQQTVGDRINIAAWNIQYANKANKRQALDDFLAENKVDIMFLSETRMVQSKHNPLRFDGYQVFETRQNIDTNGKVDEKACAGLAFIVRDSIFVRQDDDGSNYNIVLKVKFNLQEQWTLIGSYIPPAGKDGRTKRRNEAKEEVAKLTEKYQSVNVMHMGDLNHKMTENVKTNDLLKWMLKEARLDSITRVPQVQEQDATHKATKKGKAYKLDHFLVSKDQSLQVSKVQVHHNDARWTSASDHHPISLCLNIDGHVPNNVIVVEGINRPMMTRKVLKKGVQIAQSNRFEGLHQQFMDQDEQQESDEENNEIDREVQAKQQQLDTKAQSFVETIHQVAQDNEVLVPIKRRRQRRFLMSKKGKQLANRAHCAFKKCNSASPANQEHAHTYYQKCKHDLSIETNRCIRTAKVKQVRQLCETMGIKDTDQPDGPDPEHEPKILWNNLFNIMGKQGTATRIAPQRDNQADGSPLVYDDDLKLKLMTDYFVKLLTDPDIKSVEEWKEKFIRQGVQQMDALPGNDQKPSWKEVHTYIKAMPRWKVGGTDGVKAAFFKGVEEREDELGATPNTPLGKVLYYILCEMFELGLIPQIWQEGKTILIFKGGKNDPSEAASYRGITVMASVLKMLVATVVDRRLKQGLDQFFRKEQAGFRGAEECSAHVVAFYEVVMARKAKGLKTFACLIDIKNAYDTVPINAFIAKLELAGVNGKTIQLIRELYRTAQQKLHTHLGLSEFIRQMRGLRQGDPSSPIIFNIFINDIFNRIEQGVAEAGISVEGLQDRLLGLLFADDLVIWAETPDKLREMMHKITEWGNDNHMTFGIAKCGVMGFGTGAFDDIKLQQFTLQTKLVPVVSVYKYLGVIITTEMDMEQMVNHRITLGLARLNAIRPTLRAQWLPIYFRVKIIKSMLIPVLTWGAELWGLNPKLSEKLQSIIDKAINIIYGFTDNNKSFINKGQAMLELDIPPICAIAAAAVARGKGKYVHSKTVISVITKRSNPHSTTWTAQADMMLSKAVKKYNKEYNEVKVPVSDTRGRNMYELALNVNWKNSNTNNKGILFERYEKYNLANTNHIIRNSIQTCPNSMDFRWLLAARGGQLQTVNQLTHSHIVHENIDFVTNRNGMCPWCSENVKESTAHIVLHCERFNQFRGPLQSVLNDMVWEVAKTQLDTGDTIVLHPQSPFQDQQLFPRPEDTDDILFYVAIGGTWKDDKVFQIQRNGKQLTTFWLLKCKHFLSRAPGVPSHYVAVQKVLSDIFQHRNFLLDQYFVIQEQSKRSCWLFRFLQSEPTPIGRARITDDGDDSSLDGASVTSLDPE